MIVPRRWLAPFFALVAAAAAAAWLAEVGPGPAGAQGPSCFGVAPTITATPGRVTLGTSGDDVIVGTSGPDTIRGGSGDDIICSLGGADEVHGNRGEDRIRAGRGADLVYGGKGDDRIIGGSGPDELRGNSGDDRVSGNSGDDTVRGGPDDDHLRGKIGRDEVRGNAGIDDCRGGPDPDRLFSCNEPPRPAADSVTFTAGGDIGATAATDASLTLIDDIDPWFHLALGDLSYSDLEPEQAWCDYVTSHVGSLPFQLVVGNHEDDDHRDGFIGDFAACLPDRMDSVGRYGVQYYFDVGELARVIMIAADNEVGGVDYQYTEGSAHHQWLENVIEDARARDIPWVIVGMHKVCITAGIKSCQIGPDVIDLLLDERVDLILHGHEHNYQRSKQLACAEVGRYDASCVVDDGADDRYRKGAGAVWAVVGATGGSAMYPVHPGDPEFPYLAASMGDGDPLEGRGFLQVELTASTLEATFVGSTTSYADTFVISAG